MYGPQYGLHNSLRTFCKTSAKAVKEHKRAPAPPHSACPASSKRHAEYSADLTKLVLDRENILHLFQSFEPVIEDLTGHLHC